MQHFTLLSVGSPKTGWIKEGCADYMDRLKRSVKLDAKEVPASKQKDPAKQREEESMRVSSALEKMEGDVWVLDEKGERMASHEFAFLLGQARDAGRPLIFVLGGAYGLTNEVKQKAHGRLRLSEMTLPHELCRVVFLEQLYRAGEILRGSGYHH